MSRRSTVLLIVLLGVTAVALLRWNAAPEVLTIRVGPSGAFTVEGRVVDQAELKPLLHTFVTDHRTGEVRIIAAETSPAGVVVGVMETARAVGARDVNVMTEAGAAP